MISIDRTGNTSVSMQLIGQMRFLIASGQYQPGDVLPSTRALGKQIGISFHTVRKAYQALEHEGLITSSSGRGFKVLKRTPQKTSELIERGATVVNEALRKLVGLGLSSQDIDYLFQEQFAVLEQKRSTLSVLIVDQNPELAELWAIQIRDVSSTELQVCGLSQLTNHPNTDFVFAPFALVRHVMDSLPGADIHGIQAGPDERALARIARMLAHETLGLITRDVRTIPPTISAIQQATRFPGQILAASLEGDTETVNQVIDQSSFIVVLATGKRRFLALYRKSMRQPEYIIMHSTLTKTSIDRILETLPRA